ncbi:MAG: c-type cytochrome [Gemmatimonadetes bacterium]|nr:c-type cytochrome [Gemmatimonadota bacterium]
MTKRHTRLFFIGGTLLFAAIFVGLTIDSHRQFGELTNADMITEDVIEGKHVWHRNNCINCHTLFGEGAYYAPDLTKITQQRGAAYLTAFLRDPSQFYSEEVHRRLMPNPNLNDTEIAQVIAFLDWVANVDNQGWPPRPIVVSSGAMAGSYGGDAPTAGTTSDDPVARGEALFRQPALACTACHAIRPGVTLAGPSLAGMAMRAEETVADPSYTGSATDAEGYIRESIVSPSVHLVPGANFSTGPGGISLMPGDYGTRLEDEQISQLVAYLATLR